MEIDMKKIKIAILDAATVSVNNDVSLEILKELGEVKVNELTAPDEIVSFAGDCDAVLCNKTVLDAKVLSQLPSLKYIGLFATGYNNIDVDYCHKNGITVCNAGEYSTNAVAQHTFAMILDRFSRISNYNSFVEDGGWIKSVRFAPFVFPTDEIADKTIGIIGYGSIGRAVAKIALAFNMRVLVNTRTPKEDSNVTFTDLETLLEESDIVSVHCPLTDKTKGMFNKEAFAKMKAGSMFINTSRGGVVVEADLCEALKNGKLKYAAVDVISSEPMRADCPLYKTDDLTITPHVAWAPITTRKRLVGIVYDNLKSFLGGTPKNVV